jgi:hypothetical protein
MVVRLVAPGEPEGANTHLAKGLNEGPRARRTVGIVVHQVVHIDADDPAVNLIHNLRNVNLNLFNWHFTCLP